MSIYPPKEMRYKEAHRKSPREQWPEKTMNYCKVELLKGTALKQLCEETGVPMGTLYRWKRGLHVPRILSQLSEEMEKNMAQRAAQGAMAAVELMAHRITRSAELERKREQLYEKLEHTLEETARKLLEKRLKDLEEPLSASSLTTMYKALAEKTTQEAGTLPLRLEVVLGKDGEEYAG